LLGVFLSIVVALLDSGPNNTFKTFVTVFKITTPISGSSIGTCGFFILC
jgi:hypothetical protein